MLFVFVLLCLFVCISVEQQCSVTRPDQLGPFWQSSAVPVRDHILCEEENPGQEDRIIISGTVYDLCDTPIPFATVDIWSCDKNSIYDSINNLADAKCRAIIIADENGFYWYETSKPPAYVPRPPHIHYRISNNGEYLLTTQLYFVEDGSTGSALDLRITLDNSSPRRGTFDLHVVDDTIPVTPEPACNVEVEIRSPINGLFDVSGKYSVCGDHDEVPKYCRSSPSAVWLYHNNDQTIAMSGWVFSDIEDDYEWHYRGGAMRDNPQNLHISADQLSGSDWYLWDGEGKSWGHYIQSDVRFYCDPPGIPVEPTDAPDPTDSSTPSPTCVLDVSITQSDSLPVDISGIYTPKSSSEDSVGRFEYHRTSGGPPGDPPMDIIYIRKYGVSAWIFDNRDRSQIKWPISGAYHEFSVAYLSPEIVPESGWMLRTLNSNTSALGVLNIVCQSVWVNPDPECDLNVTASIPGSHEDITGIYKSQNIPHEFHASYQRVDGTSTSGSQKAFYLYFGKLGAHSGFAISTKTWSEPLWPVNGALKVTTETGNPQNIGTSVWRVYGGAGRDPDTDYMDISVSIKCVDGKLL